MTSRPISLTRSLALESVERGRHQQKEDKMIWLIIRRG